MAGGISLKRASSALGVGGALVLGTAAGAQHGEWRLSSGVDYAAGDYGEASETTIILVPISTAYVARRWSASITVPFASIDGPGVIVPGGLGEVLVGGAGGARPGAGRGRGRALGAGGNPGPPAGAPGHGPPGHAGGPATQAAEEANISESGLSDVTLRVSVTPIDTDAGWRLSVTGGVRAPTGDEERSLGTGETAAHLAVGLSKRLGRSALYGVLGAERAIESEVDGAFAGVGAESYVGDRTLMGASVTWSEATSELLRDSAEAALYAGYDFNARLHVRAYGAAGLTETSPEAAGGVRLVLKAR